MNELDLLKSKDYTVEFKKDEFFKNVDLEVTVDPPKKYIKVSDQLNDIFIILVLILIVKQNNVNINRHI